MSAQVRGFDLNNKYIFNKMGGVIQVEFKADTLGWPTKPRAMVRVANYAAQRTWHRFHR